MCRAIEQAELRVSEQRNALREAEASAKEAERRYRQLVQEADTHKGRASEAARAAQHHAGTYEVRPPPICRPALHSLLPSADPGDGHLQGPPSEAAGSAWHHATRTACRCCASREAEPSAIQISLPWHAAAGES